MQYLEQATRQEEASWGKGFILRIRSSLEVLWYRAQKVNIVLPVCIVGRTPFPQIKQSSIDIAKLVAEACKA